jgi:hypothetical protein
MSQEELEAAVTSARGDRDELKRLCVVLDGIAEDWARKLRVKAITMRLQSRASQSAPVQHSPISQQPGWVTELGISAVDGRPLYQYRISKAHFDRAQEQLRQRAPLIRVRRNRADAALFVLWAAEWFRRCYRGGMQRWGDLGREIDLDLEQAGWRSLADAGLQYWKIRPLRLNGFHLRLSAIARQGGFPVAALEGDNAGWAGRYLERLTGLLLGEPSADLERADAHALAYESMVPPTWRHDGMRTVCAELALQIVLLRREAEEGGAVSGSLVSAWLDHHRPDWRERLPLVIEDGGALVDGLMRTTPLKGGSGSVRATRLLVREGSRWRERARLDLHGVLRDAEGRGVLDKLKEDWSRLRLYPSGEFARHASGELAVVEPGDDGQWIARPTTTRSDFDLPASVAIEVELRGDGKRVCHPFSIPHGNRLSSGLRACIGEPGEDGIPPLLSIIGTGSGSYRPDQLYLDVPFDWRVELSDNAARAELIEAFADRSRNLWRVDGTVLVRSSDHDCYLIRCGQSAERRDSLSLIGTSPRGCTSNDPQAPLFAGLPRFELREGGRHRSAGAGEVWWRQAGAREWRSIADQPTGHCELAWLDGSTRHIRDRVEAIILPPEFAVERAYVGDWIEYSINSWPGGIEWRDAQQASTGVWGFPRRGGKRSATTVCLVDANRVPLEIRVPLPCQAWISHWVEGPTPRNARLSMATLNRYVASCEHPTLLMADLLDVDGRGVPQGQASWWVEGDLPLSAIRDDLAALLRPFNDLRAKVRLNFNDGNDNFWYVHEFETALEFNANQLVPTRAVVDVARVVARALRDPAHELDDFPVYAPGVGGHRPIEIPRLQGEWLIYLRSADRIISEPRRIVGDPLSDMPNTPLARAMAITDRFERSTALDSLCEAIAGEPDNPSHQATLKAIIGLTVSLDGLCAGTFDILGKVASHAALGPLLLFNAAPSDLDRIMLLADELPLVWASIPRRHWLKASEAKFEQLHALMPESIAAIAQVIGERRREIVDRDDALAPLLELPPPRNPLNDVVQSFLNRSGDRARSTLPNPFRPEHDPFLPGWSFPEDFWRALDAPIATALAASERCALSLPQLYCVKDVARRHPRYFREAFASALQEF